MVTIKKRTVFVSLSLAVWVVLLALRVFGMESPDKIGMLAAALEFPIHALLLFSTISIYRKPNIAGFSVFAWFVATMIGLTINDLTFYILVYLPENLSINFPYISFLIDFIPYLFWLITLIVFLSKLLLKNIFAASRFFNVLTWLVIANFVVIALFSASIEYVFGYLSWQNLSQILSFFVGFVMFDLAILCLIYSENKGLSLILSGCILLIGGDFFIDYSFLSQTKYLEAYGELLWFLGLLLVAFGLLWIQQNKTFSIKDWFRRSNAIKSRVAFLAFSWSMLNILPFFIFGYFLFETHRKLFLGLPLFVMLYSISIVILALFMAKTFEVPFRKLYQNIETLKLGNGQAKLKTDFSTEEFISLQKFIIEAFKYKEEKDRAKKQLGEITAQVAHDIRSPTAAILMLAKNSSELPEDRRIILREAANRIQDIANNLLVQYRTQDNNTQSLSGKASDVLVSTAIASIISEKKVQPDHEYIQFITKIQPAAYFAFIKIDLSRLTRTISNLINNASEAMNHRGTIKLILEVEDLQVKIIVRDEGNGMPAHLIEKIKNAEQITSGKKDGHGLGLHYALETVQQAQGGLDIQSTEGEGTDVILQFPRLKNPAWMAEAIHLEANDTIVILDDDLSIHGAWDQRLQSTLAQNNTLSVKHFHQGLEAIQFINQCDRKDHIFLLTDYELLKQTVNGLDVIEETRVPRSVLVTSHYTNPQLIERVLSLKTTVLPKLLASEVEIKLQEEVKQSMQQPQIVDAILIDDESFNHTFWQFAAKKRKKILKCFESLAAFEAEQTGVPFETPLYIDLNLKDESGLDVARKLHERGFTALYIATGLADFAVSDYPFLSGVRDKQPPF